MSKTTNQRDSIEALDARFQQRRKQVPVLDRRAEAEGIKTIRAREDIIPLLFPHTTYKSYPESLIAKGRWAQLNRWLDSLSTYRVTDVDVSGVEDIDGWIERLESAGHLVSSSSGTSGKSSFLNKTRRDREASQQNQMACLAEAGIPAERSWHVIPVGPETGLSAHNASREMLIAAYARPDAIPVPRTQGRKDHYRYTTRLAAIRKAMADGTAEPDEIAEVEAAGAQRQRETEERLHHFAEHILKRRGEQIFFNSMVAPLFRLCEILKESGASEGDITGENALMTAGGLKGNALPPDYQTQIYRMLNITPARHLQYYSMQELNLRNPKCLEGRYHVPEGLVLFVLDKDGEAPAPESDGQVEGRAAFFDLTIDGRWGGTISGDKILVDLRACPCGRPGQTIFPEITRYADLRDDDKITCAGTIDAYVRGFVAE
ncbi:hypothetical protein [Streptomyces himalayensis]|uniref:Uncharacterized protein n=1 Tax=Streptomyces himalayensis subsp. himalayensis TaxID=2756131 RepID=A0A7W0DMG8_9ACTN|nr:hypothetical protein [Streptomyces himalayensis]MBA2947802.1 hypothetical protein [Streptomyces himalayensis subsp. himalayensis]